MSMKNCLCFALAFILIFQVLLMPLLNQDNSSAISNSFFGKIDYNVKSEVILNKENLTSLKGLGFCIEPDNKTLGLNSNLYSLVDNIINSSLEFLLIKRYNLETGIQDVKILLVDEILKLDNPFGSVNTEKNLLHLLII